MSLESKHIDKTVDFKAINSYKKNVNILNRLGYEDAPEFKELLNFLKQFRLNKADKEIKANITSPNGRYFLPDTEKAGNFFSLLNQCHTKKFALHFREMQITDIENDVGSGIMLDFDIYQESNKNPLETKNCQDFSSSVMDCLINMLDYKGRDVVESYVGIIVKPRLVFNKDKNLWKNGFHMLIPNIWLAREQKKMFLQEILNNKECQREFMDLFEMPLSSALDMQSASVPVYFVYNCKEDVSEPYVLKDVSLYKSKITNNGESNSVKNSIAVVYSNRDTFPSSINRELSLSFKGIEKEKIFYKFKQEYAKRLQSKVREEITFTKEFDDSMAVFNHFNSYVDDNLEYYRTLVTEVLDPKRAEDRKLWRDAVFAIANINKPFRVAFKEVARQFSMRCPSKYESESFESLWNQAIDSKSNNSLTYNSIVYWCKEDNPRKFNSILDKDITTIIELDAFSRENFVLNGSLFQYHFAYYIFHLFKQKFAYDVDGKNGKWYEFVIDNDEYKNGEVYKWRHEIKPDNLIIYISNRLPEIVSKVLEKAEIRKSSVEDENIVKYIESRSEKLRKSGENLYKTEFKNGVIKEAESLFRRRGFIDSLDEAENVMGVANGVLLLDDDVKFISGYHEHLVSMYSEVAYYDFDINSKESTILLKMLMNIFPENELDMFHYLMYFLATCLDNRPKDSMFLILQGSGSNGKSSLLELAKTILGQYGAKVSMSILTEQRSGSGNANEQLMAYHRGRLAFYSETNKQEEINSAVVKEFTSQESMTGRGIFEKQRTFRPKCNHVVTTNYYPVIKTTDYGIWRRMKLYRHKVSFKPKHKLDPNNKYEKEADENVAKEFSYNKGIKEAFLALLVEYYKDLQKNHGGKLSNIKSESLERDSLEYRNSMDTLNRFICENVIVSKQSSVSINEIVDAYVDFLTEEYGKSITIQKNELKQLIANSDLNCFQLAEDSIKPVYKGIRLLDSKDDDERMLEGEYFLVKNKNSKDNEEEIDDEGKYSGKTFDPLGLNQWYKNIMKM
jgi:phage/plasmid-associated DNA primase